MSAPQSATDLMRKVQVLEEYVNRCNYELRLYHSRFGELLAGPPPPGAANDGIDYSALPPLLEVYDKRIAVLEDELHRLREAGPVLGDDNALRAQYMKLQEALRTETQKCAALHSTYNSVLVQAEINQKRLQELEMENGNFDQTRRDLFAATEKLQERVNTLETENRNLLDSKSLLQQTLMSLQGKESTLLRRLTEASEDLQKAQTEGLNVKRQLEAEKLRSQSLQAQAAETARQFKEAMEEVDNVRRENKRLIKDMDASKQSVLHLQQGEFDMLHKLKESYEQLEECKVELSSVLVREGQKDVQLTNLRDQMRQLLAVQTETHNRHCKVVAEKHQAQLDELREELKAKDLELSGMKAQIEKANWEKKQKEREAELVRKEYGILTGGGPASMMLSGGGALEVTGAGATVGGAGMHLNQTVYIDELQARVQRFTMERDEFARRLESEIQRQKREDREKELLMEQLRNQIAEKERKIHKLESDGNDYRDELLTAQKEIDRLSKQLQNLRSQKEDAERRAEYDLGMEMNKLKTEIDRLRLQLEDAQSKCAAAESALAKATAQYEERERKWKLEQTREREKFEETCGYLREDVLAAEKRGRELQAQLTQTMTALQEKERTAESLNVKCQQLEHALELHRDRLNITTQKYKELIERNGEVRRQLKDYQLACERERLERERMDKECDRFRVAYGHARALIQTLRESTVDPLLLEYGGSAADGYIGLLEDAVASGSPHRCAAVAGGGSKHHRRSAKRCAATGGLGSMSDSTSDL